MVKRLKIKAVSIDYRLAPEHPYPAALEDTLAVYEELLKEYDPNKILIAGFSAGGGLALAVVLKARDSDLPLPAAVGVFTPWTDVNKIGDTYHIFKPAFAGGCRHCHLCPDVGGGGRHSS